MFCDDLGGDGGREEVGGRSKREGMDICVQRADSLHCMVGANTTL